MFRRFLCWFAGHDEEFFESKYDGGNFCWEKTTRCRKCYTYWMYIR